jgi:hypothetical protein
MLDPLRGGDKAGISNIVFRIFFYHFRTLLIPIFLQSVPSWNDDPPRIATFHAVLWVVVEMFFQERASDS